MEALTVFKDGENGSDSVIKRRNSAMSRGGDSNNQSFLNQSVNHKNAQS